MTERNKTICECGNWVCPSDTTYAQVDKGSLPVEVGYTNAGYGQDGEYALCDPDHPAGDTMVVLCGNQTSSYSGYSTVSPTSP